jgi:hypothetical protein
MVRERVRERTCDRIVQRFLPSLPRESIVRLLEEPLPPTARSSSPSSSKLELESADSSSSRARGASRYAARVRAIAVS